MKKLLLATLIIIPLTFVSCGTETPKGVGLTESDFAANNPSTNITKLPSPFSISEKTYYPSNFVASNASTYFPNPSNNGKITYISNKDIQKDLSSDLNNFYELYASSLAYNADVIYFSDWKNNNPLKELNITNEKVTKLNNMPSKDLIFAEDSIFFINSRTNELYRQDLKNKSTIKLTSDKAGRFIVNDKNVLYQNLDDNLKLYSVGIDGSNRVKLSDYPVQSFLPYEKNILFINPSDNNTLYLLDAVTSKAKRVANINGEDLKMYKKDILFLNKGNSDSIYSITLDLKNDKFTTKPIIDESVNEYYPTEEGIFYLPSIDVDRFHYKK